MLQLALARDKLISYSKCTVNGFLELSAGEYYAKQKARLSDLINRNVSSTKRNLKENFNV